MSISQVSFLLTKPLLRIGEKNSADWDIKEKEWLQKIDQAIQSMIHKCFQSVEVNIEWNDNTRSYKFDQNTFKIEVFTRPIFGLEWGHQRGIEIPFEAYYTNRNFYANVNKGIPIASPTLDWIQKNHPNKNIEILDPHSAIRMIIKQNPGLDFIQWNGNAYSYIESKIQKIMMSKIWRIRMGKICTYSTDYEAIIDDVVMVSRRLTQVFQSEKFKNQLRWMPINPLHPQISGAFAKRISFREYKENKSSYDRTQAVITPPNFDDLRMIDPEIPDVVLRDGYDTVLTRALADVDPDLSFTFIDYGFTNMVLYSGEVCPDFSNEEFLKKMAIAVKRVSKIKETIIQAPQSNQKRLADDLEARFSKKQRVK